MDKREKIISAFHQEMRKPYSIDLISYMEYHNGECGLIECQNCPFHAVMQKCLPNYDCTTVAHIMCETNSANNSSFLKAIRIAKDYAFTRVIEKTIKGKQV
jgi:hypothetical protein